MKHNKTWWKESIIYQIYPRSFQDSNGDGIGDIPGIIRRLDHLEQLGVETIWLGPVYDSPNDDNGYDISDYRAIHPDFGTMDDFDRLLEELHRRDMKLVMDLVVNHTSDEHHWFQEAKKSKDSPYRDYYIWRDAVDDQEPTDWLSFFGGSAWEWEPNTEQYYLHLFTKKQPDLNWENPKVREEVKAIMRYWLDKGIDGFRMDVISVISKRYPLRDAETTDLPYLIKNFYANGPRVHEFLRDINKEVTSHYDIFTVGEGPGIVRSNALKYVGRDREELDMIFHFDHMFMDHGPQGKFDPVPFDLESFLNSIDEWDSLIDEGGWISPFFDNHDFQRLVSRFGDDGLYRKESAKLFAILLLSLRGTPSIYQGTEIGMTNKEFKSIEECRDVETLNFYKIHVEQGGDPEEFMKIVSDVGRDNVRTPMQWDGSKHAGFTEGEPWIDVNPNYVEINVQEAKEDPDSILAFYKKMIALRRSNKFLVYGSWQRWEDLALPLFAYERSGEEETWLFLMNFSSQQRELEDTYRGSSIVLGNYNELGDFTSLRPWEAVVLKKSL